MLCGRTSTICRCDTTILRSGTEYINLLFNFRVYISSWIYEKVLFENRSTSTKILLNRALNQSNGPKSKEKEQVEGKEEGEKKKLSILMFLYCRL